MRTNRVIHNWAETDRTKRLGSVCLAALAFVAMPALAEGEGTEDKQLSLERITVSGERTERSLKETSSSVAVFSDEFVNSLAVDQTVNSLLSFASNVTVVGGDRAPTIRGQNTQGVLGGSDAFVAGLSPRVAVNIDGRAQTANDLIYGEASTFDIERVEIFRGPQTTTQGKNSAAGAIYVVTRDPTYDFQSEGQLEFGSFETRNYQAALSGPIIADELAFRLAFNQVDSESWVNITPDVPNLGAKPGTRDSAFARAKLLFEPKAMDGLSAKLTYFYADSVQPQNEGLDEFPLDGVFFDDKQTSFMTMWDLESESLIGDVDFDFKNGLVWSNVLAKAKSTTSRLGPENEGRITVEGDDLTFESILSYDNDGRLSAVGGIYFNQLEEISTGSFFGSFDADDTKESLGVFGEVTIGLTDRLFVTGGARYQQDSQERVFSGFGDFFPPALTFVIDDEFDAVLPKVSVAFDVTDRTRIGFTASKGFTPGGGTTLFSSAETIFYDEETIWNYEAFLRSEAFDGRLILNANAFYSDYSDAQRSSLVFINSDINQTETRVDNAESAEAYGLELQAQFLLTDSLQGFLNAGYLETELSEFSIDALGIEGNEFAGAPSFTSSFGINWSPNQKWTLSAQGRYTGSYYSDDANDETLEVGGFFVADAKVTYEASENFELFLNATNIFDEFTPTLWLLNDPEEKAAFFAEPQAFSAGFKVRY